MRNQNNPTSLHGMIASGNDLKKIEIYLKSGANPDILDDSGYTALHKAITNNNPKLAEILLKYKANPNIQNQQHETPLDLLTISNSSLNISIMKASAKKEILELLLKHGAKIVSSDQVDLATKV